MIYALARLVRLPNLLIVALTQYLLYHVLFLTSFQQFGVAPRLDFLRFSLLILVTLMLTAGGYVINDVMDLEADRINKPKQMVISRYISRRTALWLYFCLQVLGLFLAIYLAFYIDNLRLLIIYPLAAVGLYAYSSHLKRRAFVGHLLIAAYCAGVALIVWLAERPGFLQIQEQAADLARLLRSTVIAYAVFAFLTTLLRELIKALEDEHGDRIAGYRTTVIAWGQTRVIGACMTLCATLLIIITLSALYFTRYFISWKVWLVAATLVIPILFILYYLGEAQRTPQYRRLSRWTKLLMLLGILVLLTLT